MEELKHSETVAGTSLTAVKQKMERLLSLEKIMVSDLEGMNALERQYFSETCTARLQELKDTERDRFLAKIEPVMQASMQSKIWEHNHAKISNAVSMYMNTNGLMPTKNQIAEETGLSRQTVTKHFKEYSRNPGFAEEMEQFKFMAPRVLSNVYKFALKGDMRATRLYFEMIGALNQRQNNTVVNEQNNFIQINNTILSQENLKRLSAVQLQQIEDIVRGDGVRNNRLRPTLRSNKPYYRQ